MFKLARKQKYYQLPKAQYYTIYKDMLEQPHLLIAGATGSGKSVIVNEMLHVALLGSPQDVGLILIDPKRVELLDYKKLPHTLRYASEPQDIIDTLQYAIDLVNNRYVSMSHKGLKKYDGSDVYVVIDELADLMTTDKKHVQPMLQRLCQIGRAAKVHVIACTQSPICKVIPTEIKVNFDARIGLRTSCAQDSRNILGVTGCEKLPRCGVGYYKKPEGIQKIEFHMTEEDERQRILDHWTNEKNYIVYA